MKVRILRASGDESESHVRLALADQLLRSAGYGGKALRSGGHVALGLELLELISSSTGDAPCVVVVDDAHLTDAESLRALLFAARRLLATRAMVVLVVRGTAPPDRASSAGCYPHTCADILAFSCPTPMSMRAFGRPSGSTSGTRWRSRSS